MNQGESQGIFTKKTVSVHINASTCRKYHADRKKCKPIFHTKYFHSDQNRSHKVLVALPNTAAVSKCRAEPSVAVLQACQMHRWKKAAVPLRPETRSTSTVGRAASKSSQTYTVPPENACAIRLVPSPQYRPFHVRKKETPPVGSTQSHSLVWIFQYVSHKLFYFLQKRAVPSDRTKFQKESDMSPSLCPSMTGSAKEEPKIFPAPAHAKLQMP